MIEMISANRRVFKYYNMRRSRDGEKNMLFGADFFSYTRKRRPKRRVFFNLLVHMKLMKKLRAGDVVCIFKEACKRTDYFCSKTNFYLKKTEVPHFCKLLKMMSQK